MVPFHRRVAERVVAELQVDAMNRALAEYWLSLWQDEALPSRASLKPAELKTYLPNLVLFDTLPNKSVSIRLVGTYIERSLKTELTGKDWIAMAPKSYRAERLRILSTIARGGLGVGHRRVPCTFDQHYICEELLLPFAEEAGGTCPVMAHVSGTSPAFVEIQSADAALGIPLDFKVIPLR